MDGDDAGLLQPKLPMIARTLHRLWKHPDKTYTSAANLHNLPGNTTPGTVYKAIDASEEQGWVERGEPTGKIRPLHVTDRGDNVFSKLGDLLDAIDCDLIQGWWLISDIRYDNSSVDEFGRTLEEQIQDDVARQYRIDEEQYRDRSPHDRLYVTYEDGGPQYWVFDYFPHWHYQHTYEVLDDGYENNLPENCP